MLSFGPEMLFEKMVSAFLPPAVRHRKTHPAYYELHNVVSVALAGIVAVSLIPLLLLHFGVGKHLWLYYLNVGTIIFTLVCVRLWGVWRPPTLLCAAVAYFIVYTYLDDSGLIYSTNMSLVYLYLIAALLTDFKLGRYFIATNLFFIGFVYYQTVTGPVQAQLSGNLGSPLYALLMHAIMSTFIGSFLAYGLHSRERSRQKIKDLQDNQIHLLDEAVRQRTEQLANVRQTIATDFHDHTGNMLAAINRQAALLELRLSANPQVLPMVQSIIANSNELYASSKDFLWNLNHDSDNPHTLFQYLTAYGQRFYNQFDISFSASVQGGLTGSKQLHPFAALNLIYIFKEAMSNVIKHSGADEVTMILEITADRATYTLTDNGTWKPADPTVAHYGLSNMQKRCAQSGFDYDLQPGETGTTVSIALPLHTYSLTPEFPETHEPDGQTRRDY